MQIARTLPSSSGEKTLARADAYAAAKWAFGQAARRGPMHTCDLRLAGRHVRLQVARRALFDCLRPAISHLETQLAHPRIDLTINLWDVAETGVPLQVPVNIAGPFGRDRVEVSADGRIVAYGGDCFSGWLDRAMQQMYVCFPSARHASLRDRAKPIHHLLAAWHLDRHVPLVRGSVIGRDGAGVLLAGHGDTGASIASLSCALAGFDYLGDDTIALEPANGSVRAHSVYCSATIGRRQLDRYPSLAPYAVADATGLDAADARVVLLNRVLPRPLTRTATLTAIVIPKLNGYHRAQLSPASRIAAQAALTPTTELASPAWHATHAEAMASAVDQLPCYWLEMGPDAARVPECLGSLLDVTRAAPVI